MAGLLDTPFLQALAEPSRLEVLKVLLIHGSGDVASVSQHLPQDRSVVSRHLKTLEDAGILRSTWEGRHRIYALDGIAFIARFELLASRLRALAPVCCPPPSEPPQNTAPRKAAPKKAAPEKAAPKKAR